MCVESLINMNREAGFLRGSLAVFSLGLSPHILSVTYKGKSIKYEIEILIYLEYIDIDSIYSEDVREQISNHKML